MSQMLRPAEIAVLVQQQLNDKAIELFGLGEIAEKIVFNVTADYQLYERMQKAEYEVDDYQPFTPVIIARVDHYEYPADYLRYEETYTIGIYGFADQIEDLERLIKAYTVDENTINKSVIEANFRITKEATDVSFDLDIEPMDGSMKKRVIGTGGFSWTFLDGIMTSYDTIVSIDGEEMPYITWDWGRPIESIQSQTIDATGLTSNSLNTKPIIPTIVLPYISTSAVIKDLYEELYSEVYNKTHTLTYYDSAINKTYTYTVRISGGAFVDTQPKVLEFALTFERVLPTVSLTIDAVAVPMLKFQISSGAELSTATKINSDVSKSVFLGTGYQLTIALDLSDTTNTKTEELLSYVLNQTFETPHSIILTKGALTAEYDVLLNNGSYSFEDNPVDRIDLVFVEVDSE